MCRLALLLTLLTASPAHAGLLSVAPSLLDVPAPGAAATLTLRNDATRALAVQIRIFKWTGTQGEPVLVPNNDVAVSPPAANLEPGRDYTVRVVRLTRDPVKAEESYRVLVDELPDTQPQGRATVHFLVRYSIPVFFSPANARPAQVTWSLQAKGDALLLTAVNTGGQRLRVANLKLVGRKGETLLEKAGLVGYSLSGSSVTWTLPGQATVLTQVPARVSVESESGAVSAAISAPAR